MNNSPIGKRNRLTKSLEKRIMLKMKLLFQVHQHGNTNVVTSVFVFYFHAVIQFYAK